MQPNYFQPAIYEHAAAVIGQTPWAVSRSLDLLTQAHAAAFERYQHTPITVGIDIYNLEAEAYGAVVQKPDGTDLPSISNAIFSHLNQLLEIKQYNPQKDGRLPLILKAGFEVKSRFPQSDVRIPVSGPFSIASLLLGFENLLMAAIEHPEVLAKALSMLAENQLEFVHAIHESGLQVTIFESAATPPLISPGQFREIEKAALQRLVQAAKSITGHSPSLIMGGDTAPLVDDLVACGTGYLICPAETDQTLFMQKMTLYPDLMVRINMHSRLVAFGNPEQLEKEILRVLQLAKGRDQVCLGTGVLPYETPADRVTLIRELLNRHV